MSIPQLWARGTKLAIDNSPTILTAVGVAGTLATAVLSTKASFKAERMIREHQEILDLYEGAVRPPFEKKDKVLLVWKEYLPAAGVVVLTTAAIIGANRVSASRMAALAAAYKLSEKQIADYRDKVLETVGVKTESNIRRDVAQDGINENPPSNTVILTGGGDVLFKDNYTGRYFTSTMETVRQAENRINNKILHSAYATLSDFYNQLGLDDTSFSDEVGWADDMLELMFSTCITDDGRPCIVVDFGIGPVRGFPTPR